MSNSRQDDPAAGLMQIRRAVGIVGALAFLYAVWLNKSGDTASTAFTAVIGVVVLASFAHVGLYVAIKRRRGETSHRDRDFF